MGNTQGLVPPAPPASPAALPKPPKKAPRTMGRPRAYDWRALWNLFKAEHSRNPQLTQENFSKKMGVNASQASTNWAEFKRQEKLAQFRTKNTDLLLKSQDNIERALSDIELDSKFQASFSLDALKAIADREGMSPQASILNITASANANAVSAPLFATESDDFKKLMGGE